MIGIECSKDMFGELRGVSIGEEIVVDLFELFDREIATRAVLEEAFVPLLDLLLVEVGHFGELV